MSFMSISGIIMPVAAGGASEGRDDLKTELRAIDGEFRRDIRASKRRWSLSTRVVPLSEARALRSLVMGEGHHWGFAGASKYSGKGLGSWVGAIDVFASGGPFGGRLVVAGTNRTLALGARYATRWTVAQWAFDADEGAYVQRIQTSDGRKYTSGVATPAASWGQALFGGVYTVPYDGVAGVGAIADLVILPYELPASWAAQWPQGSTFSPLPRLSMSGEVCEDASVFVEGRGEPVMTIEQGVYSGVYQRLASVSFELVEV